MVVKSGGGGGGGGAKPQLTPRKEHYELSILKIGMLTQIHYILTIRFSSCKTLSDYKTACLSMII